MEDWFADIDLSEEEPTVEGPSHKNKKKTVSAVTTIHKYSGTQNYFQRPQSSHSVKKMHELLAVGVEFSNLKMVKIETDHRVPRVNSLIARLNKPRPRNWMSPFS